MKKHLFILAILVSGIFLLSPFHAIAQAPAWDWATHSGGKYTNKANSVATDVAGNVYVLGQFQADTIAFESVLLTKIGSNNFMFLAKYDSNGNILWVQIAGPAIGIGLVINQQGAICVTGTFLGSLTLGSYTLSNSSNNFPVFLAKFDSNGNVIWATNSTGVAGNGVTGIDCDNSGNIFLTGNPTYVSKFDSGGNFLWSSTSANSTFVDAWGMACDRPTGNTYEVGRFVTDSVSFDNFTVYNSHPGTEEIFIVKYDGNGNALWAKSEGGNGNSIGGGNEIGTAADVDPQGNLIVAGYFNSDTFMLGSTSLYYTGVTGDLDLFIAKYDASGNILWAKSAGSNYTDAAKAVSTDMNGDIFMTGFYQGPVITFGTFTLTGTGSYDPYLVKYNSNGAVQWVATQTSGGIGGGDAGNAVCPDGFGNVYIAGDIGSDTVTFGSDMLIHHNPSDMYVAKIGTFPTGINADESVNSGELFFPNPFSASTTLLSNGFSKNSTLVLYNSIGQEVKRINYSAGQPIILFRENLPAGIYFVQLMEDGRIYSKSKIIIAD